MLLWGGMPEIGLEIELEVGCVGGCGGFTVAVPEGVQRVCVRSMCQRMWRSMCRGLRRAAEGVQRVSCYNVVSL